MLDRVLNTPLKCHENHFKNKFRTLYLPYIIYLLDEICSLIYFCIKENSRDSFQLFTALAHAKPWFQYNFIFRQLIFKIFLNIIILAVLHEKFPYQQKAVKTINSE